MIIFAIPDLALILPNPQLEEGWTVDVKTTFGHTMDGTIRSFRYTPAADKFLLPFTYIPTLKKNEVETFFVSVLDNIFTYTDPFETIYNVRLIDENIIFTNAGRWGGNQYLYNFELNLEVIP